MDYLFLADEKTVNHFLKLDMSHQSQSKEKLGIKLRHLAIPLSIFESLLKIRNHPSLRELFRTFPNLEEIVIVVGDADDEALKRGDAEFVMLREENVPRKGLLVGLCMEVFQPWRAFAHLLRAEMMEDAVEKWVEDVMKDAGNVEGREWKAPKFRLREVRCASGSEI
ncbi:hypothetical protein N431DRAFT_118822 [Stipitochalara longipes BDJ]|nr:hypothetical protein N431DRAFT_118822 [Stipitochalara longipes BDJ]